MGTHLALHWICFIHLHAVTWLHSLGCLHLVAFNWLHSLGCTHLVAFTWFHSLDCIHLVGCSCQCHGQKISNQGSGRNSYMHFPICQEAQRVCVLQPTLLVLSNSATPWSDPGAPGNLATVTWHLVPWGTWQHGNSSPGPRHQAAAAGCCRHQAAAG